MTLRPAGLLCAVLLLTSCGGLVGADDAPTYADLRVDEAHEEVIADQFAFGPGQTEDPTPDTVVDPARFAIVQTLIALYDGPSRRGYVAAALEVAEGTRASLGGQGLNDARIEEIMAALAAGSEDLPVDVFLDLPDVVDLVTQLESGLAPIRSEG